MNRPVVSEEVLGEPVLVGDLPPLAAAKAAAAGPAYIVLIGISFSHFLNDTMQSLIASVYPILKDAYALNFAQIGMIMLIGLVTKNGILIVEFANQKRKFGMQKMEAVVELVAHSVLTSE